jgi:hypothetical protein
MTGIAFDLDSEFEAVRDALGIEGITFAVDDGFEGVRAALIADVPHWVEVASSYYGCGLRRALG